MIFPSISYLNPNPSEDESAYFHDALLTGLEDNPDGVWSQEGGSGLQSRAQGGGDQGWLVPGQVKQLGHPGLRALEGLHCVASTVLLESVELGGGELLVQLHQGGVDPPEGKVLGHASGWAVVWSLL